ncbi:C39 family peptidase [Halomonas saccharevitans]|uniref:C39 family peptidase n=1 Tax=Halomonas saccharevitans TaxID=416872 RepID=A0ABU3NE49_9GAMM|nr:C39 family peptidase [Halomonas saccharevitans]MDT8878865.1 C39 family peptidase [Halomonas saccharevitans]
MASLLLIAGSMEAIAGQVTITNRFGNFQVEAKSLQEKGWDRVIRQEYDFSCGSAAVATLLTYHYQRDTTEAEVFETMIRAGDAEKIQRHGFSMLDMKGYLDGRGLNADGFRISLDDFIRIGVPAITMVNTGGYKHFVVVKGIDADNILVGDPAAGTLVVPREHFENLWNGTVLGARDEIEVARQHFNHDQDWAVRPDSPLDRGVNRSSVGASLLTLPAYNELGR